MLARRSLLGQYLLIARDWFAIELHITNIALLEIKSEDQTRVKCRGIVVEIKSNDSSSPWRPNSILTNGLWIPIQLLPAWRRDTRSGELVANRPHIYLSTVIIIIIKFLLSYFSVSLFCFFFFFFQERGRDRHMINDTLESNGVIMSGVQRKARWYTELATRE